MTTTEMVIPKSSGLAKSSRVVRDLAHRLERARQSRNEKVARADAEYVEAVRRAVTVLEPEVLEAESSKSENQPAEDRPSA
jgi:hypothetical protein